MIKGCQIGMDTRLMKRNAKRGAKGVGKTQITLEKVKPGSVTLITGLEIPLELWLTRNKQRK